MDHPALTDIVVRQMPSKERRFEVRDGKQDGLWLRVTPSGKKTWVLRYRYQGAGWRYVLGEFPTMRIADARGEAAENLLKVTKYGKNPAEERRLAREARKAARLAEAKAEDEAFRFADLADRYIRLYATPRKRSWREDRRKLDVDVIPQWAEREVEEITRRDVQRLLDGVVARGSPVSAARLKALLSRVFRWAVSRGYLDLNPVQGIESPAKESPRDRVLSGDEIRTFWKGLDGTPLSSPVIRALRLILVTAQRPGEVVGLRFEEIQEHNGCPLWIIPGGRRKKQDAHAVPLSDLAEEIIGEWRGRSGPVFDGKAGESVTVGALAYALRRTLGEEASEPPPVRKHGKRQRVRIPVAKFTPHDLRRSAATRMSDAGVSGLVKPMVLGHSARGITRTTYDLHDYLPDKRLALNAWGRHLRRLVADGGTSGGAVVKFPEGEASA